MNHFSSLSSPSRLTRNKSQLSKKNISQSLALLSVYLFLNLSNDRQTNIATLLCVRRWDGVTLLYLFILQLFTLSLLQFDFILEMREKNVEKCYLEVYTAYNSGKKEEYSLNGCQAKRERESLSGRALESRELISSCSRLSLTTSSQAHFIIRE